MQLVMFYLFGFGALVSAILLVTSKKPVAAAMSLIMTMLFLAGLYVLLDAHLIAALQVIVYAGAIMVLFLFVIMLLNLREKAGLDSGRKTAWQFFGIIAVSAVFISAGLLAHVFPVQTGPSFGTTKAVAELLFTDYLLPFEIASILLLAALLGAVILAKRRLDD
jgi:NADH-quinone oxidoreductase subunit J